MAAEIESGFESKFTDAALEPLSLWSLARNTEPEVAFRPKLRELPGDIGHQQRPLHGIQARGKQNILNGIARVHGFRLESLQIHAVRNQQDLLCGYSQCEQAILNRFRHCD